MEMGYGCRLLSVPSDINRRPADIIVFKSITDSRDSMVKNKTIIKYVGLKKGLWF
jgi:hypothetical protein